MIYLIFYLWAALGVFLITWNEHKNYVIESIRTALFWPLLPIVFVVIKIIEHLERK